MIRSPICNPKSCWNCCTNICRSVRFCSLGSGSRGNAHIVEKGETTLLIECGFSPRTLKQRLAARYVSPHEITAVFISHEHGDHIKGLPLMQKHNIPFHMSAGTARALQHPDGWRCLAAGDAVRVGELTVQPMPVPHDVNEPMQFIIDDGVRKLAIFTDLGYVSRNVHRACREADALVLECNYDEKLLWGGDYPEHVKQRIAGDQGHLSNTAAAALVADTKNGKRRHIIAAHISEQNNDSAIVKRLLQEADSNAQVHIVDQKKGTDWIKLD